MDRISLVQYYCGNNTYLFFIYETFYNYVSFSIRITITIVLFKQIK